MSESGRLLTLSLNGMSESGCLATLGFSVRFGWTLVLVNGFGFGLGLAEIIISFLTWFKIGTGLRTGLQLGFGYLM